jgi:hypothetical protein
LDIPEMQPRRKLIAFRILHQILHSTHLSEAFPLQTFPEDLVLNPLYLFIQNPLVLGQLSLRNLLERDSQLLTVYVEVEESGLVATLHVGVFGGVAIVGQVSW